MSDYVTTAEAALMLGICVQRVRELIRQGRLEHVLLNMHAWGVSRASVENIALTKYGHINIDGGARSQPSGYAISAPGW